MKPNGILFYLVSVYGDDGKWLFQLLIGSYNKLFHFSPFVHSTLIGTMIRDRTLDTLSQRMFLFLSSDVRQYLDLYTTFLPISFSCAISVVRYVFLLLSSCVVFDALLISVHAVCRYVFVSLLFARESAGKTQTTSTFTLILLCLVWSLLFSISVYTEFALKIKTECDTRLDYRTVTQGNSAIVPRVKRRK